jgi:hypothetical protein
MGDGYSIDTYIHWTFWAPIYVFLLMEMITAATVITHCCLVKVCYEQYISLHLIYSKAVFRDALKKEDNVRQVFLHGYKISEKHLLVFSAVTSLVMFSVFLSFWTAFVVEETFVCNPLLDCFFNPNSSLNVNWSQLQPVDNCSHINTTVMCYQFVFDMTGGFASAGGFLTVAVFYVYIYGYVTIWLMKLFLSHKYMRCCSVCGCLSLLIAPFIVSFFILVIASLDPFLNVFLLQINKDTFLLKFFAYFFCFICAGPLTSIGMFVAIAPSMCKNQCTCKTGNSSVNTIPENPETSTDTLQLLDISNYQSTTL